MLRWGSLPPYRTTGISTVVPATTLLWSQCTTHSVLSSKIDLFVIDIYSCILMQSVHYSTVHIFHFTRKCFTVRSTTYQRRNSVEQSLSKPARSGFFLISFLTTVLNRTLQYSLVELFMCGFQQCTVSCFIPLASLIQETSAWSWSCTNTVIYSFRRRFEQGKRVQYLYHQRNPQRDRKTQKQR